MNNIVYLIGRLTKDPEKKELESGKKVCNISLAVPRSYKNEQGEYDVDFIDCVLWNGIAERAVEYCKKGDLIAIRGQIKVDNYEKENGEKIKTMSVTAERISFLSTKNIEKSSQEQER